MLGALEVRPKRQTVGSFVPDTFVCPGVSRTNRCPVGRDCEKERELCSLYRDAFEPMQGWRTQGEVTLKSVSQETCAARCARLAPACRHYSFSAGGGGGDRGRCILGCRKGYMKCTETVGELVQDPAWTFHFASAHRLAGIATAILSQLADEADINKTVLGAISGALTPDRFGGRKLDDYTTRVQGVLGRGIPISPGRDGDVTALILNGHNDLLPEDCGRVPEAGLLALVPLIVHGTPAAPGQYPWQARILVREGGSLNHRCGGIVITEKHVLTAAHCLQNIAIGQVEVSVGEVNLDSTNENVQRFTLQNMILHRDYQIGGQHRNDIMLLRLRLRRRAAAAGGGTVGIVFNSFIQPACLPRADLHYDSESPLVCQVSGWGKTTDSATIASTHLRGAEVPLVTDAYCGASEIYGKQFYQPLMFCAGFTEPGSADSCGGDSGGPLACPLLESERYAVFGIVSHSHPKGCGNAPGVYTRVEHYAQWILDTINFLG